MSSCIYIVHLSRTGRRLKKRRSPLDEIVFRSPGQSLIKKIDDLVQDLGLNGAQLVSIPLVSYAGCISHLYYYPGGLDTVYICIFGATGTAATGNYLIKTLKLLKRRRQMQIRYDSALAVGQELNRLMLEGYYVYHDFAADRFSIDHLVVGRSGIFAVATGARSNFKPGSELQAATVGYSGNNRARRAGRMNEKRNLLYEEAIEKLENYNITGAQVYLIDLIPLIEMIWADGKAQDAEVSLFE